MFSSWLHLQHMLSKATFNVQVNMAFYFLASCCRAQVLRVSEQSWLHWRKFLQAQQVILGLDQRQTPPAVIEDI